MSCYYICESNAMHCEVHAIANVSNTMICVVCAMTDEYVTLSDEGSADNYEPDALSCFVYVLYCKPNAMNSDDRAMKSDTREIDIDGRAIDCFSYEMNNCSDAMSYFNKTLSLWRIN